MSEDMGLELGDQLKGYANLIEQYVEETEVEEIVLSTVEKGNRVYQQAEKFYRQEFDEEVDIEETVEDVLKNKGYDSPEEAVRDSDGVIGEELEVEQEEDSLEYLLESQQSYLESVEAARAEYGETVPLPQ